MRKVIAIDFDGTLCENEYPKIGKPNKYVIERALKEQKNGAALILWTCREGKLLDEAVAWCKEQGIVFDSINESMPDWIEMFGTASRKIGATEYWDDRAVNPVKEIGVKKEAVAIVRSTNDIEELMLIMRAAYLRICKIIQQTISDEKKQCANCPFACQGDILDCIGLGSLFHTYFDIIKKEE